MASLFLISRFSISVERRRRRLPSWGSLLRFVKVERVAHLGAAGMRRWLSFRLGFKEEGEREEGCDLKIYTLVILCPGS